MSQELVPNVEQLRTEVAPVLAQAQAFVILTPADYSLAGEQAKRCAAAIAVVHTKLDPICATTDKAHKDAVALRASFLTPLSGAKDSYSQKQLAWQAEQERIRLAEQRRLQAIADEAARKERERAEALAAAQRAKEAAAIAAAEEALARAAAAQNEEKRVQAQREAAKATRAANDAAAKAEAREEAAAAVAPAPVIQVASVAPVVKGQSLRTTWKATVTDPRAAVAALMAFPDWSVYVKIDQGKLNGFASRTKGAVQISGVVITEETLLASSSK